MTDKLEEIAFQSGNSVSVTFVVDNRISETELVKMHQLFSEIVTYKKAIDCRIEEEFPDEFEFEEDAELEPGKWTPITPGGSILVHLTSDTEDEAWKKLIEDASHMPYGSKEAFQDRGYTVELVE